MPSSRVAIEPLILDAIERYFAQLQAHVSAEQMLSTVVTDDFETGFVGGFHWQGPQGLEEFLDARSEFFDESHDILEFLDVREETDAITARTRLRFFLRRREGKAARSMELTGQAFHLWRLRELAPGLGLRVAAQLVEGFALLNEPARALFSAPDEGLNTEALETST